MQCLHDNLLWICGINGTLLFSPAKRARPCIFGKSKSVEFISQRFLLSPSIAGIRNPCLKTLPPPLWQGSGIYQKTNPLHFKISLFKEKTRSLIFDKSNPCLCQSAETSRLMKKWPTTSITAFGFTASQSFIECRTQPSRPRRFRYRFGQYGVICMLPSCQKNILPCQYAQ